LGGFFFFSFSIVSGERAAWDLGGEWGNSVIPSETLRFGFMVSKHMICSKQLFLDDNVCNIAAGKALGLQNVLVISHPRCLKLTIKTNGVGSTRVGEAGSFD
jgi:hypothetical protein